MKGKFRETREEREGKVKVALGRKEIERKKKKKKTGQVSSHVYVTKLELRVRCTVNECDHRNEVKERRTRANRQG